jgi:3-hydroxybutyryl-CoA dehydrogenase
VETRTIAVIGAGHEGQAIALLALLAGYKVVLEDFSVTTIEHATAAIQQKLSADSLAGASRPGRLANLTASNRVEDAIRDADLIVEAAADEMETKLELFTLFDKFAKPNALLATTSKLHSISEIAEITTCPDRCVAIHFQLPPAPIRTDLIPGAKTSPETLATCQGVFAALANSQEPGSK